MKVVFAILILLGAGYFWDTRYNHGAYTRGVVGAFTRLQQAVKI